MEFKGHRSFFTHLGGEWEGGILQQQKEANPTTVFSELKCSGSILHFWCIKAVSHFQKQTKNSNADMNLSMQDMAQQNGGERKVMSHMSLLYPWI